jgi:hypothetical protein
LRAGDPHLGVADLQSHGTVTSSAEFSLLKHDLTIVRIAGGQQKSAVLAANLSDLQHFTTS